jgi:hypothetical protein
MISFIGGTGTFSSRGFVTFLKQDAPHTNSLYSWRPCSHDIYSEYSRYFTEHFIKELRLLKQFCKRFSAFYKTSRYGLWWEQQQWSRWTRWGSSAEPGPAQLQDREFEFRSECKCLINFCVSLWRQKLCDDLISHPWSSTASLRRIYNPSTRGWSWTASDSRAGKEANEKNAKIRMTQQ